ncbi:MAG: hypothetical protein AAGD01_16840 [Acidobacteriota bacterium]
MISDPFSATLSPQATPSKLGAQVRGTGLISTRNWIRHRYDASTYRRILERFGTGHSLDLSNIIAPTWYPIEVVDSLWDGVREVAYGSLSLEQQQSSFEAAMVENGRYIAADNLGSIYRVYLTLFSSPLRLVKALPRFGETYFHQIDVEPEVPDPKEGWARCRARGLEGVRHIAPVICGWLTYALDMVGARSPKVEEKNYRLGVYDPEELHFEIFWLS